MKSGSPFGQAPKTSKSHGRGPLLFGVTIPSTARAFLTGQLTLLAERHTVYLTYGDDGSGPVSGLTDAIVQLPVSMVRDPSPVRDVRSFVEMVTLVARIRPDVAVFGTPKMGLLGTLAAWLLRVPRRVYVLYGLRFEGASGIGRRVLLASEKLAMACATEVLAISHSNRAEVLRQGLTSPAKVRVLDKGAIGGVDVARFAPANAAEREASRHRFGIPHDADLVGYVGRLTPDKGLGDMVSVWRAVLLQRPTSWLLVVGPDEASHTPHAHLVEELRSLPRVVIHGPVPDIESVFAGLDVLMLLTRREGFGTVLIEAAACEVPAVVTRVNGTVDAVVDGVTGTLVEWGDVAGAAQAIEAYLADRGMGAQHGRSGRQRVLASFSTEHLDAVWAEHFAPASEGPA